MQSNNPSDKPWWRGGAALHACKLGLSVSGIVFFFLWRAETRWQPLVVGHDVPPTRVPARRCTTSEGGAASRPAPRKLPSPARSRDENNKRTEQIFVCVRGSCSPLSSASYLGR